MLNIAVGLKVVFGCLFPIRNNRIDDGVDNTEHLIVGFSWGQVHDHFCKGHQCDEEGNPIFDEKFFHVTSVSF